MLEKHKLPRNKVCTGVLSGMAEALIRNEFGDIPLNVLTVPPYISGLQFHALGVNSVVMERRMPFAWRKDLDYWLNQVAERASVEVWDKAKVKSIQEDQSKYTLTLEREGEYQFLKTRFLIGADGAISTIRRMVFPDVQMRLQFCVRLCYQSRLALDPEYFHIFYWPDLRAFGINYKADVFLLEVTPRRYERDGSDIVRRAHVWLSRDFGFDLGSKPLWRDGCYEPALSQRPFPGLFPLAKDNVLLVGNAAGLNIPVTGEGIGTAISSGLMAAAAVVKASETGRKAADFYIPECQRMIDVLGTLYPPPGTIREAVTKGMDRFLQVFKETYSRSMDIL